ncbi:hypothetical protein [Algoriphagus terrigena]|uniref:hypothetical protein n=1 Tax=Algoriphagus terrigena TaxID=344884 RepID=UPI0012FA489B|nr:hypothetical protein [Algoriphagus terrigena]
MTTAPQTTSNFLLPTSLRQPDNSLCRQLDNCSVDSQHRSSSIGHPASSIQHLASII